MPDPMPRAPSLVSLLAMDQTAATNLNRLVEEMAAPFVEFFRTGLAAGTLFQEDFPSLIDTISAELVRRFLEDAHRGYEVLGPADCQEYAELIVSRVRRTLCENMGLV